MPDANTDPWITATRAMIEKGCSAMMKEQTSDRASHQSVTRAFHVLFESQTLHKTQDYQYLKLVGLVQFKPDLL